MHVWRAPHVSTRHYNPSATIDPAVKATFDGSVIRAGKDGRSLYEQSGYGRMEKDGLRLSPQEALYLLHRHKIDIEGYSFDTLFSRNLPNSGISCAVSSCTATCGNGATLSRPGPMTSGSSAGGETRYR